MQSDLAGRSLALKLEPHNGCKPMPGPVMCVNWKISLNGRLSSPAMALCELILHSFPLAVLKQVLSNVWKNTNARPLWLRCAPHTAASREQAERLRSSESQLQRWNSEFAALGLISFSIGRI